MGLPRYGPYQPTVKERKALRARNLLNVRVEFDGTRQYSINGPLLRALVADLLVKEATVSSRSEFDKKAISINRFASEVVGIADDGTWSEDGIEWVHKAIKDKLSTNPNNNSSVQHEVRDTGTWLVKDTVTRHVDEGLGTMPCWALTDNVSLLNTLDIVPRNDAMERRVLSHQRVDGQLADRVPETRVHVLAANMVRLAHERALFDEERAALTEGMGETERRELVARANEMYESMVGSDGADPDEDI